MNIAVPIKLVPDLVEELEINDDGTDLERDVLSYKCNEVCDHFLHSSRICNAWVRCRGSLLDKTTRLDRRNIFHNCCKRSLRCEIRSDEPAAGLAKIRIVAHERVRIGVENLCDAAPQSNPAIFNALRND